VPRPAYELAGIFRQHGPAYRAAHPLSRQQLRAMRAIEICRTATLGAHVEECSQCRHIRISYNSCRNRHCPKCQNAERAKWLEDRKAQLLPVEYFHVVFTLPEEAARIAFHNQTLVYNLLFRAASETLLTIARDPKHLGAQIGFFGILHTWGQNLLYHPHLHCVVPGGGLSPDRDRWVSCRAGFFLPVRVLSRLFRRLFLAGLEKAFRDGQLRFSGVLENLAQPAAFSRYLAPLGQQEWVVYAKPPFGGPRQALEYLGRYTHRVALSNDRIRAVGNGHVTFQWKDYRRAGRAKSRVMTLAAEEFIRRFLLHVLPPGFQRIRHFGLLANRHREQLLALCRHLLTPAADLLPPPKVCRQLAQALAARPLPRCPQCGAGLMITVGFRPAYRWPAVPPADSS